MVRPNCYVTLLCALLLLLAVGSRIRAQVTANSPAGGRDEHVTAVAEAVAAKFNPSTGLFDGTGWWNSANGITALADASRVLGTRQFDTVFATSLQAAPHRFPSFLNEFYDDEGWWALAWIDVYQLRGDPEALRAAQAIFTDMTGGWTGVCGGGIWWKKNEHYKNAIANELFLSVAASLAQISQGDAKKQYLDWAEKEEKWFLGSGMINSKSLVNDGLDASCKNNQRETWTYNQGVLLTGLAKLYQLTGDSQALAKANQIAGATLQQLTDKSGVLHDSCESKCGEDGVQFKGIFVRNLATLAAVTPSAEYTAFLQRNAESAWSQARTQGNAFSENWAGPPQNSGTGPLIAALDVMTAAAAVTH